MDELNRQFIRQLIDEGLTDEEIAVQVPYSIVFVKSTRSFYKQAKALT